MTARLLLCDDEPLATDRLAALLERRDDVEVVGVARSGAEALARIAELHPDAVLIDVEMPELDGFDVVEALAAVEEGATPLIIFVTAYPQFATNAFDSGAIDFLTKPVRFSRLEKAIDRLQRAIDERSARRRLEELSQQLDQLRSERQAGTVAEGKRLWVSRRGEMVSIALDKLDRISAEGEYVRLYQGDRTYLHRSAIVAILPHLDQRRFVRIHRSHIVALENIASIKRRPAGGYRIVTAAGDTLPVGRTYHSVMRAVLGGGEAEGE